MIIRSSHSEYHLWHLQCFRMLHRAFQSLMVWIVDTNAASGWLQSKINGIQWTIFHFGVLSAFSFSPQPHPPFFFSLQHELSQFTTAPFNLSETDQADTDSTSFSLHLFPFSSPPCIFSPPPTHALLPDFSCIPFSFSLPPSSISRMVFKFSTSPALTPCSSNWKR